MIKLGCAAYRALANAALSNRGHTGLLTSFEGQCVRDDLINHDMYKLLEMQKTPENGFRNPTWPGFYNEASNDYWGTFENSPTYQQRLKILGIVNYLHDRTLPVTYNLLDCIDYTGLDWDGSLQTIKALRCDGLVEVCMEMSGVNVWGLMAAGGGFNYSIVDFCSDHELMISDDNGTPGGILTPRRQCGRDPGPVNIWLELTQIELQFDSALYTINDEVAVPLNISPW